MGLGAPVTKTRLIRISVMMTNNLEYELTTAYQAGRPPVMDFRIADTFTESLTRLTCEEQKVVKTTAFDLQLNPANPGMRFHKVKSKDLHFWSVRVGKDLRIIVHRTASNLMLCYADHHDAAYAWAERRRIERHPQTGAARLVEIRECVREIVIPRFIEPEPLPAPPPPRLFAEHPDWKLLGYGIPSEWIEEVLAATEETLFDVTDHLSHEAAEALLELATGAKPPVTHPELLPRVEVLDRVFRAPLETSVSLSPSDFDGFPHTDDTMVALHRVLHFAHAHPQARVLLTMTFSDPFVDVLGPRLLLPAGDEPGVEVHSTPATNPLLRAPRRVSPHLPILETRFTKRNKDNLLTQSPMGRRFAKAVAQGSRPIHDYVIAGEWPKVMMANLAPTIFLQPSQRDMLIERESETNPAFRAMPQEIAISPASTGGLDLVSDWMAAQRSAGFQLIDARTSDSRHPSYVIAFAIKNAAAAARLPTTVVCTALFQGPAPV
jgi:mRNA-degrading endonuclease RelE of RelBE toxin-antitoxin system